MKRRRTAAIVPRAVFAFAAVGVVPVCVTLANCGGAKQEMMSPVAATGFTPTASAPAVAPDAEAQHPTPGVAAPAFGKY